MTQDFEDLHPAGQLRALAAKLDRIGLKLTRSAHPEVIERAGAILRGPGAAMVLTLRVDAASVVVELIATGAASGRVVVAAQSSPRARPGPKQKAQEGAKSTG